MSAFVRSIFLVRAWWGAAVCLCLAGASASAGVPKAVPDVAIFDIPGQQLALTKYVRWLVETDGPWTPEQAAEKLRERPPYGGDSEWLQLEQMDAVVWLAVPIRNATDEEQLVFEFRNPRMNYVDFYAPNESGGYDVIKSGSARPFDIRPFRSPMPAFPMKLHKGETTTVLLRLENNGIFNQRIWLWDPVAYTNRLVTAYISDIISIGVLAVLMVYQLLVFFALRERSYLYLCLFVMCWLMFLMAGTGLGKMLLWRDWPWLTVRSDGIFIVSMGITFILFAMTYLDARKYMPWLHKVGWLYIAACTIQLCYISFVDSFTRFSVNRGLAMAGMTLILLLGIQAWRKGNPSGRFFLFTWTFVIIGGVLLLLLNAGVLPVSFFMGSPVVNLCFTTSILLWTLELINRVRMRAEEQRLLLEAQVKKRTAELEAALSDVKTLSGLLPICSSCKKIRDDGGYWSSVEHYIGAHTDAGFTHGICPDCYEHLYPELAQKKRQQSAEGLA